MQEEIKEILQELKEKNETYKECSKNGIIENEYYKSHKLLDYITNLQEENIKLKELCDKYEEEHKTTFEEWKKDTQILKEIEQWLEEDKDKIVHIKATTEFKKYKDGYKYVEEK